ncbi:cobalamin B12-binding domain-containing protein [Paenibacillus methanolicus]|uniref:Methanogenic corrinoid protein MtbC1 n=1 Tax=Paenibacillus methanolicus TaxID=582686 RepID=A0A5S5BVR7_9BACL|nr:cobalamin B12-binding domain-containing protein [Paenibacillus methanolicus]TYP70250.1 methanogenic corrinoid protein MtbC1 [Paenibacillus methanolicus]
MQLAVEEIAELMLAGRHRAVMDQLERYRESGANRLFLYDRLLKPAMRHIGELWENNLISVADEHLASGVCEWVLERLGPLPDDSRRFRAMLLCTEGELHDLGLKMCAGIFREHRWDTRYYGPNLPLEYAMAGALHYKPDVIAMSLTMQHQLVQLRSYADAFLQLMPRPAVVVGSRLVGELDLRPHVPNETVLLGDLFELSDWLARFERSTLGELQQLG